jgi:hypothetical protein
MPNLSYQKLFSDVCSQDVEDDGLSFLSGTIRVERIRDEETHGLHCGLRLSLSLPPVFRATLGH